AVGDLVVFAPHGAGVVVASEIRDDAFGEYLTIRIVQSTLTLSVPAALAEERGVRAILDPKGIDELLRSLTDDASPLHENAMHRSRAATDQLRTGEPDTLAALVRNYVEHDKSVKKLSPSERKVLNTAKAAIASEIAVVREIDSDAALAVVDQALGFDEDDDA
ncbi:MAG: CarD family transcriptional regulator, partial [Thermoleophilia bacterium]|nr:CarD family transcriptional regulator [Thermoleophilia bacterium]